jgi:hypothetical protein
MAGKLDFERAQHGLRIAVNGYEPIAKDYAEFPSKSKDISNASPPPTSNAKWINGQPNPRNIAVLNEYLLRFEEAIRRGEQPKVPKLIANRLARQIDAIRMNPEVRKAYHSALAAKQTRR